MKHGFYVMGVDNGIEFSYGKCETYRQACRDYWFAMKREDIAEDVKKTLRLVELVEKELPIKDI